MPQTCFKILVPVGTSNLPTSQDYRHVSVAWAPERTTPPKVTTPTCIYILVPVELATMKKCQVRFHPNHNRVYVTNSRMGHLVPISNSP